VTPNQIDSLRDLAIEHLPRAQVVRASVKRMGSRPADFYRQLAYAAIMVRGDAASTVVERTAAEVLESVALLAREEPLTAQERDATVGRLASAANELCTLTGTAMSWLPSPAAGHERQDATPADIAPVLTGELPKAIAGRYLSTKEAAQALGVGAQTLRKWASTESGPISPSSKVAGRLKWSGDEILSMLSGKKK
jgi:hypothetical protein